MADVLSRDPQLGINNIGLYKTNDGDGSVVPGARVLATGDIVALISPPPVLTANADTPLTFAIHVRHVLVQNNTTSDKHVNFDAAASLGTILVPAGLLMAFDVPCTVLHVWSTAADNLNGSVTGNVVVLGWS